MSEGTPPEDVQVTTAGKVFAFVFLVVGAAFGVFVLYRIYPAHHPHKPNPGFVDAIFANNLVLFASRLVLFCVAVVLAIASAFVIASIFNHWFRHKQWITSFGPFQVAERAVEELREENELWQTLYRSSTEEVTRLTDVIEESNAAYDTLLEAYTEARLELEALRGGQAGN
jgi:hypothetical protein